MKQKLNKPDNVYIPFAGVIASVKDETPDAKLFKVALRKPVRYGPGQFFMVSVWGSGEAPISITSLDNAYAVDFCIRKVGSVTSALHSLKEGDTLWLRGPYGNGFPVDIARGGDIVIVAGGLGIAPLRPVILEIMRNKSLYGKVSLLFGSRNPSDIIYLDEVDEWKKNGINVVLTVDRADEKWQGHLGLVTTLWHKAETDFRKAVAYVCGPEVMIKAAMSDLFFLGMPETHIITTLESHMKCGIGKCGHCYTSARYICTDGPVFSYKEIKENSIL